MIVTQSASYRSLELPGTDFVASLVFVNAADRGSFPS
jgi:hypothetical protein